MPHLFKINIGEDSETDTSYFTYVGTLGILHYQYEKAPKFTLAASQLEDFGTPK